MVSVTDVAVRVTVPPDGTVLGAVYVVGLPLGVEVGLNVPHVPIGVQVQFTPAFLLSFVTVADTPTLLPVIIDEGGNSAKVKDIGWGPVPPPPLVLLPPPPQALRKVRLKTKRGTSFLFIRSPFKKTEILQSFRSAFGIELRIPG